MAEGKREKSVKALETMIASIRESCPEVPVYVSLIAPPAGQDGVGTRLGVSGADQTRLDQQAMVQLYLENFQRPEERVDVFPLYFNLDRWYDYDTRETQVSSRNPARIIRQINNVHPSVYGYLKFADVYYATILYSLAVNGYDFGFIGNEISETK